MALGSAPAAPSIIRRTGEVQPDRLLVYCPGLDRRDARRLATESLRLARLHTPKLSGKAARGLSTTYGDGFFGITWREPYLWWQEAGRRPQTMRYLAGKVIPMWVDDPTGSEARKNPKAKRRMTANGRAQILIFRKAAKMGARKTVRRRLASGGFIEKNVPQSYPGAPGRIARRQVVNQPGTRETSKTTGLIGSYATRPHIGVRWRHPGLRRRDFLANALVVTAAGAGWPTNEVHAAYRRR